MSNGSGRYGTVEILMGDGGFLLDVGAAVLRVVESDCCIGW